MKTTSNKQQIQPENSEKKKATKTAIEVSKCNNSWKLPPRKTRGNLCGGQCKLFLPKTTSLCTYRKKNLNQGGTWGGGGKVNLVLGSGN